MKSVTVGLFQHRNGTFYTIKRTGEKQAWRSLGTTDKNEAAQTGVSVRRFTSTTGAGFSIVQNQQSAVAVAKRLYSSATPSTN
jgi:hypothetical protein